jgi:hypothetical protein
MGGVALRPILREPKVRELCLVVLHIDETKVQSFSAKRSSVIVLFFKGEIQSFYCSLILYCSHMGLIKPIESIKIVSLLHKGSTLSP